MDVANNQAVIINVTGILRSVYEVKSLDKVAESPCRNLIEIIGLQLKLNLN